MKYLVFDMDGTIVDLYNYPDWLLLLKAEKTEPYEKAKPLYNMKQLNNVLLNLKNLGFKIIVTSWMAKNASPAYKTATAQAKTEWLDNHNFPYDELHFVQYGATKANSTRKKGGYQILVDDNEKVRRGWNLGGTINANENILNRLTWLYWQEKEAQDVSSL